MLHEAADIDRRSFSSPWANDASPPSSTSCPQRRTTGRAACTTTVAWSRSRSADAPTGRATSNGSPSIPSARRRRFAQLLLDDALDGCNVATCREVMVNTAADNRPALALYESIGFERQPGIVVDPRASIAVTSPRAPRWRWIIAAAAVLAASPATSSAHPTTITQRPHRRRPAPDSSWSSNDSPSTRTATCACGTSSRDWATAIRSNWSRPPAPTDPAVVDPATPPGSDPATSDPAGFDPATSGPATSIEPEPEPDLPALTLEITNYQPLADSDDVARLVGSGVDPDAFTDVVDGVAIDARPLLTPNDDGTVELTLDVGTDVVDSVESRLKMDRPGLYPVRIQLLVGDPDDDVLVATAGTVVQRLAGALDTDVAVAPPIDLSVVTVTPGMPPGAERRGDRSS
jgi:hypothetical protein